MPDKKSTPKQPSTPATPATPRTPQRPRKPFSIKKSADADDGSITETLQFGRGGDDDGTIISEVRDDSNAKESQDGPAADK